MRFDDFDTQVQADELASVYEDAQFSIEDEMDEGVWDNELPTEEEMEEGKAEVLTSSIGFKNKVAN